MYALTHKRLGLCVDVSRLACMCVGCAKREVSRPRRKRFSRAGLAPLCWGMALRRFASRQASLSSLFFFFYFSLACWLATRRGALRKKPPRFVPTSHGRDSKPTNDRLSLLTRSVYGGKNKSNCTSRAPNSKTFQRQQKIRRAISARQNRQDNNEKYHGQVQPTGQHQPP